MYNFYFFSTNILFRIDCPIDNNKLNNKAYQNPETANPSIRLSQIKIMTALITNKKSPNVIIVTGIVKNTKIGFKNVFNIARTMATINDVEKLSTTIPGKKCANIKTTTVVIKSLISKFIFINLILKIKKRHQKWCLF